MNKPIVLSRNPQLDFLRGAAMFLVVLGHSGFCGSQFIYLFHVPAFFIVSGALFKVKEQKPFAQLGQKVRRLYLPNFWFGLLFVALHNAFCSAGFYPFGTEYSTLTDWGRAIAKVLIWGNEKMGGALWFLRSLFVTYLIYWLVEMICRFSKNDKSRKIVRWVLNVSIVVLGWISLEIDQLYGLRTFVSIPAISYGFVLLGRFLPQANKLVSRVRPWLCLIVCFTLLCIASFYFKIDLAHLVLPNALLYYLLGVCGLLLLISFARVLDSMRISKVFEYIGQHSISILGLHFLSFKAGLFIIILGGGRRLFTEPCSKLARESFYPFIPNHFCITFAACNKCSFWQSQKLVEADIS